MADWGRGGAGAAPSAGAPSGRILCFGDSLTAGYYGVWPHPTYGPRDGRQPGRTWPRFAPYSTQVSPRAGPLY